MRIVPIQNAQIIDLTGQSFGRLRVLGFVGCGKHREARWLCVCECGSEYETSGNNLRKGHTRSCGCLHADVVAKHNACFSPEYRAWDAMKSRCRNPKNKHFAHYGGRGISICARWLSSFENFFADMGNRPSAKHSLDRIDNDGNYEPSNCRWATSTTQIRNRSNSVRLSVNGEYLTQAEMSERFGIPFSTLRARIARGWSIERSIVP